MVVWRVAGETRVRAGQGRMLRLVVGLAVLQAGAASLHRCHQADITFQIQTGVVFRPGDPATNIQVKRRILLTNPASAWNDGQKIDILICGRSDGGYKAARTDSG